jgi:peroxiredoxin Q/BCP
MAVTAKVGKKAPDFTLPADGGGTLRAEWRKVKVPGHVDEVLQAARQL